MLGIILNGKNVRCSLSVMPSYFTFIAVEIAKLHLCKCLKTYCYAITLLRTHRDWPPNHKQLT